MVSQRLICFALSLLLALSVVLSSGAEVLATTDFDPLAIQAPADQVSPMAEIPSDGWSYRMYLYDDNNELVANAGISDESIYHVVESTGQYRFIIQINFVDALSNGDTYDFYLKTYMDGQNGLQTNWFFRSVTPDLQTDVLWNSSSQPDNMKKLHEWQGGKKITETYKVFNFTPSEATEYIWFEQYLNLYVGDAFELQIDDFVATQQSASGKLSSIIEYIKNLPTNLKNALASLFNGITNAVTNLGNTLLEGIKGLFIPSADELEVYASKWDQLLAQRFGVLYQSSTLLIDLFLEIYGAPNAQTINIPSVTLDFAGVPWTFGGWNVVLVPNNQAIIVLLEALKLVVDMVASLAFLSALKSRYERLVGL